MNYTSKGIIDASCYGGFKRRSVEEARQVIEDLAKCNYKTPSESSRSNNRMRGNGLIGMDRTIAIEAKLDAVMSKLSSNERRMHTAHEVGVVREGRRNSAEGYEEEKPYQVEETKYMNEQRSYHFKPNPNLPTHYTPALRNHENFRMVGEHSRALNMDKATIRLTLSLRSNKNNSNNYRNIIKHSTRVKGTNLLKIICCSS